jgi:RNA polymerase sigma factor (sigma-70 family)
MAVPPGDAQLEDLVRRFSRLVRSVAARVGGSRGSQIAEDVEQEVFVNIWKQLEREQVIENPSSYIYRSAVRETIRLLNRERPADTMMDEHAAAAVVDCAPTPAERLFAGERGDILSEAIRSLPIDRRRAVQAYLAGFSVPEVMKMYGWSYDRARNLSARGMADLRAELKNRGIDG